MNHKVFLKIVLLGDSGVGKTALMNQYVNQKFCQQYKATIGADFMTKEIEIDDRRITLQIWDTAGQERFQSLGRSFYRGADCCVLMFDLTNTQSFTHLDYWYNEFFYTVQNPAPFILLGNKLDQNQYRCVSQSSIKSWSLFKDNIPYFEISAKTGQGVDNAFMTIVKLALSYENDIDFVPESIYIDDDILTDKSSCCS